jgi:hypothetical protein
MPHRVPQVDVTLPDGVTAEIALPGSAPQRVGPVDTGPPAERECVGEVMPALRARNTAGA